MRVVHCKREPYTVYIGRGSDLGNPFTHLPLGKTKASVQVATIAEAKAAFVDWIHGTKWQNVESERRQRAIKAVAALTDDDVLGCYCKYKLDSPCHGDDIIGLKKELTQGGFNRIDSMAINTDTLIQHLPLVDENILAEAARQPILFIDAVRFRVAAMRRRAQAVAELESKRSRIALTIRRQKDPTGKKQFTETALKEKVESQTVICELRASMERAYEMEEFAKLILEAYRMRRDAIRVIAESQIAEGMRETKEIEHIEQSSKVRREARRLAIQNARVGDQDE